MLCFFMFTGKLVVMFLSIFKCDKKAQESSPRMLVDCYSAKEMLQKCSSQKKRTKAQLYFRVCNVFSLLVSWIYHDTRTYNLHSNNNNNNFICSCNLQTSLLLSLEFDEKLCLRGTNMAEGISIAIYSLWKTSKVFPISKYDLQVSTEVGHLPNNHF